MKPVEAQDRGSSTIGSSMIVAPSAMPGLAEPGGDNYPGVGKGTMAVTRPQAPLSKSER